MPDQVSEGSDRSKAGLWGISNRPAESPESGTPKKPQDQPLNRACEACRISKVRCLVNPDAGSTQCQRCAKAGRTCIFAPPAKRRQRKRTDVRVTELEKEIQQMRSLLKSTTKSPNDISDHDSDDESDQHEASAELNTPSNAQSHSSTTTAALTVPNAWPIAPVEKAPPARPSGSIEIKDLLGPVEQDIIDRDVISEDMARELMSIWRNELTGACPGITIPKHWTVFDLRENKPALFHAVMAAAAHSKGSALSDKLHEETVYLYARSAFIRGEKSVQAIQALLVTVAYYSPSKTPGQLQIYQWVNMAASMALELGLASKPRTHEQLPKRAIRSLQKISSPEELLEHVRTVLLLYIIGAGFSMRLKRPNMLLFNSWMEECFVMLQKSKLLEDKRIVAQLKLQRIADEANTAFGFDDASTSFSLSELRMQIILRIFDRRMQDWRKSVPDDVMTPMLNIEFHQNMLSMWEFGMDGGRYDVIEFKNRHISLPALDDDSVQPESLLSRTALQINATTKCISAAQTILDCFADFPVEKMRKAPNVLYVRAVYSLVTLMKADYAVGTDEDMSELLESQSLKVGSYLDMVLRKTAEAMGPQKCRNPSHWNFLLEAKLKSWWDEYQEWRKEGRHLKRRKTKSADKIAAATGNQTPLFAEPKEYSAATTQQPMTQPDASLPSFPMSTAYPTWNANDLPLDTSTTTQPIADPATFTPDMGDFSAAFQNGDLYLWNDVSVDNFGGWTTQGGPYGGMGYGPMNGQGF
ncbi:hypothetical protein T440DRAFT_394460 [Plenodomus tracheiphilus IPT5]|uniref:Zn(2)-C6 fungal-type domain-containing protein n=1 Tax=Plenodomus tracheiphilus IPT5 TaxID=1408161 RepID=A0A6A7BC39_9PLEO|nr:hypothetical protein T440DRAFT_394460 [Plenodomus tracheiphilus IPT5]